MHSGDAMQSQPAGPDIYLAMALANKHLEEMIAKDLGFGWVFQQLTGFTAMTPEDNDKDNTG